MERDSLPGPGGSPGDDPAGSSEDSVELIRRAQAGDRDALEQLFQRFRPRLRRWARGRMPRWARDVLDTEDLVQDTLMRTLTRFDAFEQRGAGALLAYLRQALQNRIRNELRRAHNHPARQSLPSDARDPRALALEQMLAGEQLEQYEEALAGLSDDDRGAVIARVELALSYEEIAELLGKSSPDSARMSVRRALARLAKGMGRESS